MIDDPKALPPKRRRRAPWWVWSVLVAFLLLMGSLVLFQHYGWDWAYEREKLRYPGDGYMNIALMMCEADEEASARLWWEMILGPFAINSTCILVTVILLTVYRGKWLLLPGAMVAALWVQGMREGLGLLGNFVD